MKGSNLSDFTSLAGTSSDLEERYRPGEGPPGFEGLCRSLRWRIFAILAVAAVAFIGTGAMLLLLPIEVCLVVVPTLLAVEFACGFLLSGRLMALALARHHDRLRAQLLAQQERTRRALIERWRSLDPEQREGLRRRFPEVDWEIIDDLAGTEAEASTKH